MLTKKQQIKALESQKALIRKFVTQAGQGGNGKIDPETIKQIFKVVKIAAPIVKKVSLAVFKDFIKPLVKKIKEKRKKKQMKKKSPSSTGGALRLAGQGRRSGIPGSVMASRSGRGFVLAGGRNGGGLGVAGGRRKTKYSISKFGKAKKKRLRK